MTEFIKGHLQDSQWSDMQINPEEHLALGLKPKINIHNQNVDNATDPLGENSNVQSDDDDDLQIEFEDEQKSIDSVHDEFKQPQIKIQGHFNKKETEKDTDPDRYSLLK